MIELRFHRELYDGNAVDEAIKSFDRFATLERAEEPSCFVVRVTAKDEARERKVANELGNFALGLTIRSGSTLGGSE
ncbi:MAG: hypothetical protein HYV09_21085 [Deltaproteobacteria bacterium]|nr:hypothetical protein [Deltaproteobacteria bacterium]